VGNARPDVLAGKAASVRQTGPTSIACPMVCISQHYTMAKDTEREKRRDGILQPHLKKQLLDRAPNRHTKIIAQIRTRQ
jgi:hypothetical protein